MAAQASLDIYHFLTREVGRNFSRLFRWWSMTHGVVMQGG
ncbi:hypothetical protein EDWATA_03452 [Edwardsiella tarda ATCC 23685]|uniref:Uncharacterized protein n=1 Tax=Edwardsiella tarda ATCC 23685 TaxID=500638 RepID=D4F9J3_EDWTA|nr:hypothetical protein EDWATA_03452 [Edwardsiella tarda ATCC 23685]